MGCVLCDQSLQGDGQIAAQVTGLMHVLVQRFAAQLIPVRLSLSLSLSPILSVRSQTCCNIQTLGEADIQGVIALSDPKLAEITRAHALAMLSEIAKFSPALVEVVKVCNQFIVLPRNTLTRSATCSDRKRV